MYLLGRSVEMVQKEKLLPQSLRVVNKTEGASIEAMAYMMEKKGDDHTLAVFTNTWVATPLTSKKARYTAKDLTPIVRLVLEPTIAVVRSDSLYKSMNDFVKAAKNNPGGLKQAGGSATAIESLTGLLIQSATGAKWAFASTPAVKDRISNLLAGNVQIIIPQPQDVNEHIAALTEKRLTVLPNVRPSRSRESTFRSLQTRGGCWRRRASPATSSPTGKISSGA